MKVEVEEDDNDQGFDDFLDEFDDLDDNQETANEDSLSLVEQYSKDTK